MALDKKLLNHLDEMDVIEQKAIDLVVKLVNNINIDRVIENAEQELTLVAETLLDNLKDDFYPEIATKGIVFAKVVDSDGSIDIDPEKDPDKNEDLLDETFNDGKQD